MVLVGLAGWCVGGVLLGALPLVVWCVGVGVLVSMYLCVPCGMMPPAGVGGGGGVGDVS